MKNQTVILLLLRGLLNLAFADSECPIDLHYVRKLQWDKSYCKSAIIGGTDSPYCMTLLSLFGVGLAQYLRDASMFGLPNNASDVSCLGLLQQQFNSMGLSPDLVSICFKNSTHQFVSSPYLCAGIQTKQDWIRKLGITPLDSACKGDLSDLGACQACKDSGALVQRELVKMYTNLTSVTTSKICYYFTVMYAAGVANEFGPKNRGTAQCLLGLPFVKTTPHALVLAYILMHAAAAVLLCALALLCRLWPRERNRKALHKEFERRNEELLKLTMKPNTWAVWFRIQDIKAATNNFSEANLIGQGGFAMVYKGKLPDGRWIAVNRIRNCTPEGDSEFLKHVEVINNIRHRNLVVLRGCCIASDQSEGHQRFLIYDYMANGSLDEHIFGGKSNARPLSWSQRRNILLGTAKGLAYLHDGIEPSIYHRDIKPTNILLDDEMNACVADFGLARIMTQGDGESHLPTRIAGTHGYLAPEYALYGRLTDKSDVYSFGVMLLEIMSSRKALDTSVELSSHYLITDWAWTLVKQGRSSEIIDKRIRQSGSDSVMNRFVLVGILCAHIMVAFRPRMVEVVKMLEGEAEICKIPDRPLPLMHHGIICSPTEESSGSCFVSDSVSQPSFSGCR